MECECEIAGRSLTAGGCIVRKIFQAFLLSCFAVAAVCGCHSKKIPVENHFLVTEVIDGDTLVARMDSEDVHVQLAFIDCPELYQHGGAEAREIAFRLCFERKIDFIVVGKDMHGRILAEVILPDGNVLNKALVEAGFAFLLKKEVDDSEYDFLLREAMKTKRGIWATWDREPPVEWQEMMKGSPLEER